VTKCNQHRILTQKNIHPITQKNPQLTKMEGFSVMRKYANFQPHFISLIRLIQQYSTKQQIYAFLFDRSAKIAIIYSEIYFLVIMLPDNGV